MMLNAKCKSWMLKIRPIHPTESLTSTDQPEPDDTVMAGLIIDIIAGSLGKPYLCAFLDALGSNFSHGANFATAGSTIRPPNTTLHQSGYNPISLNVQYYEFSDFQSRSQHIRDQVLLDTQGPLGCLAYILDGLPITAGQVDRVELAQYFNMRLKEAVIQLRKDLPSAALTYVDIYSVKYDSSAMPKDIVLCTHYEFVAVMEESTTTTDIMGVGARLR